MNVRRDAPFGGDLLREVSQFSLHLNMAQECMAIFEKDKLPAIAGVEQNCATGLTPEGKTPKTLVEEMVPLLDSRDVPCVFSLAFFVSSPSVFVSLAPLLPVESWCI